MLLIGNVLRSTRQGVRIATLLTLPGRFEILKDILVDLEDNVDVVTSRRGRLVKKRRVWSVNKDSRDRS